jgi:cell division protein FtsQ
MSRGTPRRRSPALPGVAAPADRRFHRADVPPERRRRLGRTASRFVRWGVGLAVVSIASAWLAGALLRADLLRVDHVVVLGTTHLSDRDVESLVSEMRGRNILHVDLDTYRRRLLGSPWVEAVNLSRVLPATVEIRVRERTPIALARLGARLYLVDASGVVIDAFGPGYRDYDLPVVDGLGSAPPSDGIVDPARTHLAAALLAAIAGRPDIRHRLSEIDVSDPHDAVVMFDDDPAWLHLGDGRFVQRLQNYIDLRPTLQARFRDLDYVDLRYDERVYLRGRGRPTRSGRATR